MHDTTLGWRMVNPRMAELGVSTESMGETAENVAERYGIAARTRTPSRCAATSGRWPPPRRGLFAEEIVPIEAPRGRETVTVDADEGPRPDASLEKLAALRPVFREGGTVTAGNASTLNDGAACLLIASEAGVERLGAEPLARVVSTGVAGVDPAYMGIGPVEAVPRALAAAGLALDEIDLIELNEAFAAQVARLRRASSGSTRSASTSTAARSPSATRSAAPAPASPRPWCASCAAAAAATASPPSASASARAWRPCSRAGLR